MKFKNFISAVMAVVLILVMLCSCSQQKEEYALIIDGTEISRQVFNYYLAEVENSAKYDGETDKNRAAAQLCSQFKAGNELISKYGITLSAEQKVTASSKLRGMWQYYSSFYTENSVSKQTLGSMIEYEMLIDNLISSPSFIGSDYETIVSAARDYFNNNYTAVKMIYSAFTDKKGAAISASEQNKLTEKFKTMRNLVRQGSSMASAAAKYPDVAKYDENTVDIICADDKGYPGGMFDYVVKMQVGATQVYKFNDGIYLIQKLDIKDSESNYFERYTEDCILKLYRQDAEDKINTLAQSYKIVYNI